MQRYAHADAEMWLRFLFPWKNRCKVYPQHTPPEETALLCETLMNACEAVSSYEGTILMYAYHDHDAKPKMTFQIQTRDWPSFEHQEKILALAAHPLYWQQITVSLEPTNPADSIAMHSVFLNALSPYRHRTRIPEFVVLSTAAPESSADV